MKRPETHEIDVQARRVFESKLPKEWVCRYQSSDDYGIDYEVEIFEANQTTGIILKVQLKGTKRLELRGNKRRFQQFEVIELRTDEKYGKFFIHNPAKAKVDLKKKNGNILFEIKDFISPTIIERFKMDEDLLSVKITDFRSMIDTVLIDTDYDGKTFNICYSDVPEKKKDLIKGTYELPAPNKKSFTVVVKITDMLGEEVLLSKDL